MITVEAARERILSALAPVGTEVVPVADAGSRVLAADVVARRTQPPRAVSAMDGYAVRAADLTALPATLAVTGSVAAGAVLDDPLAPGAAVRIFTGAPLPPGADAIVIQEDAEPIPADASAPARIRVAAAVAAGRHVRPGGLDFRAGDRLVAAGRVLTARDIGLIAAADTPWVTVRQRPRVALLSTGDELVRPGEPAAPGQIISSNALALAEIVRAAGGAPVDLGIARDDAAALREAAAGAAGADLLVTSGGASVGDHDLVQAVLGSDIDFWKIAMRPGKPLMFGRSGRVPLLGLPGNPVSSLVCALVFLMPALARLLGRDASDVPVERLPLGVDLPANQQRQDYLRSRIEHDGAGRPAVVPVAVQDSAMQRPLAEADALAIRPPLAPPAPAGELIEILRFPTGIGGV